MAFRSITVVRIASENCDAGQPNGQRSLFFTLTVPWEGSSLGTGVWRDSKAGRGDEESQWVEEKAQGCPDGSCLAWRGEAGGRLTRSGMSCVTGQGSKKV